MKQSESIVKLAEAVVAAQASLPVVLFDAENPHFHNKYASLPQLVRAVRPVLEKHGLAVLQFGEEDVGSLTTMLLHTSGEYIMGTMTLPLDKQTPQALGSAVTYARRYGLAAMLGLISDEDDDGHEASAPAPAKPEAAPVDSEKLLNHYTDNILACENKDALNKLAAEMKKLGVRDNMSKADGNELFARFKARMTEVG